MKFCQKFLFVCLKSGCLNNLQTWFGNESWSLVCCAAFDFLHFPFLDFKGTLTGGYCIVCDATWLYAVLYILIFFLRQRTIGMIWGERCYIPFYNSSHSSSF